MNTWPSPCARPRPGVHRGIRVQQPLGHVDVVVERDGDRHDAGRQRDVRVGFAEPSVRKHRRGDRPVRGGLRQQRGVQVRLRAARRGTGPTRRSRAGRRGRGRVSTRRRRCADRDRSPACRAARRRRGRHRPASRAAPRITSSAPASSSSKPVLRNASSWSTRTSTVENVRPGRSTSTFRSSGVSNAAAFEKIMYADVTR